MSIHDFIDPYDYSSYRSGSVRQTNNNNESEWTRTTYSYTLREQIGWDMSSFFDYASPPTQYEE